MKDVMTDDGDAYTRVCRMYLTINHRGIACTAQPSGYCIYNNQPSG